MFAHIDALTVDGDELTVVTNDRFDDIDDRLTTSMIGSATSMIG